MRYVAAWAGALVCATLGSTSLLAAFAPASDVAVAVTVDWLVVQRPVSPSFVGVSASAALHGSGVAVGGVATAAFASTAEIRAKMLRFPDDVSQTYHWSSAALDGLMDTFDVWSLADQAQVPNMMLTVNMVTGSQDEAAKWVAYCNQPSSTPDGAARAHAGHAAPFNVQYWLLGEDLRSFPAKYPTPQAYLSSALENATRMKAASPGIQVGAWVDDESTEDGAKWNAAFLEALRAQDPGQNGQSSSKTIDFISVRVRIEVPNRPLTDAALFPSLYGYAAARAETVTTAAERAVQGNLTHALPIAIYRYDIDFGVEGWNQDKADSVGAAIALSGMLNAFLRHDQVLTAIYAGLNRDGFTALLKVPTAYEVPASQRFGLNAYGEVLATYGQYLEGKSLSLEYQGFGDTPAKVSNAYYQAPAIARLPGSDRVPLVSVAAALDTSGRQMLLYASSRDSSGRVIVHLTVNHVAPGGISPSVLFTTVGGEALSTDAYTGVGRAVPSTYTRDLKTGQPAADSYEYTLTLERNSFACFVFSLTE